MEVGETRTRDRLLALLEGCRGEIRSGEEIAGILGVSRASVWKAVRSLRGDGYPICASTNRGYSLSGESNILSVQGLAPYLSDGVCADGIRVYRTVESTNRTANEMAMKGCAHGTIVIADGQSAGRGRFGRDFYSPPGTGLYMSFVLRDVPLGLEDSTRVTAFAAVMVCRAIQRVCGVYARIKWVNDILLDGLKICGILTEAVTDFESRSVDWITVGIGINVSTSHFPGELRDTAGSILPGQPVGAVRNRLAAEIVNMFLSPGASFGDGGVYAEYKERMALLGRRVTVRLPGGSCEALAVDIDDRCRLVVELSSGERIALSSGEISLSGLL
ncbi:MAG: biotin--[acetyl-CoA-carboxylase] ligase [Synergistaceae bacterium]|jgi:BirA family biotin operon repressor/biotin-[acetyl-CoA-carboxylase] ligase|nr:biotin--[acetyl-CoA-carboxylase] ligase [Synergistaceae bacterium]